VGYTSTKPRVYSRTCTALHVPLGRHSNATILLPRAKTNKVDDSSCGRGMPDVRVGISPPRASRSFPQQREGSVGPRGRPLRYLIPDSTVGHFSVCFRSSHCTPRSVPSSSSLHRLSFPLTTIIFPPFASFASVNKAASMFLSSVPAFILSLALAAWRIPLRDSPRCLQSWKSYHRNVDPRHVRGWTMEDMTLSS